MDENDNPSAWLAARFGFAIDTWTDRQLRGGQSLSSNQAYGQDEFGNVYPLGQPYTPTRITSTPQMNPMFLLLLIGGIIFVASK